MLFFNENSLQIFLISGRSENLKMWYSIEVADILKMQKLIKTVRKTLPGAKISNLSLSHFPGNDSK